MKRIPTLLLALALAFALAACGGGPAPQNAEQPESRPQDPAQAAASPIRFLGKRDDVAAGEQGVYYLGGSSPNVVHYYEEASGYLRVSGYIKQDMFDDIVSHSGDLTFLFDI